jgi:HEAT repeat protein
MKTNRPFARICVFLVALTVMAAASARAAEGPSASSDQEKELLAVLRSDSPAAEKAITCKRLAIHGSSAAVPDLARLLPDAQLASWARIALEAIPGPAADEALRNAAYSLEGKLLVGAINSIGVRRDANSVDVLSTRLQDKDAEVASAAAVALGRIGNAPATKSLRQTLTAAPVKVRSAIAEGCVLCAERLVSEGKSAEAAAIYDEVRKAEVPKQRVLEATRGAILARKQEGIPLLLEQFQSPDKALFQIALSTAREFPGGEVDKALAAELVRATPDRAALIVQAMADRKETVVLSAVLTAAKAGPKPVRLSAVGALARVGDDSCLTPLLKIALEGDEELAQTAKATLADLPSQKIDSQIVAILPKAEGKMYPLLIEIVGRRRIDATPALVKALDNSDQAVRSAALTALGETVALADLSVLVSQAIAPKFPDDAAVAQQALKAASVRMPDREACATELVAAMDRSASVPTKSSLLQILGAMGGTKALASVGAAAKSNDPELQDVSSRLLGEWMTEDAAPVLLDLVKSAPGEKYQGRALRGYIRIARQFVMPEKQRAEMCQKAFDASRQPAEQKMVLDVLKRYPNMESLKLAINATKIAEIKPEATEATLTIAQKIKGKGAEVKELLTKAGLDK